MNDTPNDADPALAEIRGIRPRRRGRLVEWPVKDSDSTISYCIGWARAERVKARRPRLLEEGLRWVGAGYSVVLL